MPGTSPDYHYFIYLFIYFCGTILKIYSQRILKKKKVELPYDPIIPHLVSQEIQISVLKGYLHSRRRAKIWKQLKHSSVIIFYSFFLLSRGKELSLSSYRVTLELRLELDILKGQINFRNRILFINWVIQFWKKVIKKWMILSPNIRRHSHARELAKITRTSCFVPN